MSNQVNIVIKKEVELDMDLNPKGNYYTCVYLYTDEVYAYLGEITDKISFNDIAGPENILDSIYTNLSSNEIDNAIDVLRHNDNIYYVYGKKYRALEEDEIEGCI